MSLNLASIATRPVRICPAAILCTLTAFASSSRAAPVDFQREVRPILAEHCLQCHGPDEDALQAELRLDLPEVALERAIVPGDPDSSELLHRVTSTDPGEVMPPPAQQNPLSPQQIATLRRWISGGAAYTEHWAFVAPQAAAVPAGGRENPIDHLVSQRLRREGLQFSDRAALPVLCRRIYLDIVGLPPTPREIDEFVAASRTDHCAAVSALIDRLLASDHFGEKWARHWLDVARYADTNGFEKDMPREQWAWRDWVIRAINDDMPYDRFLIEQIAGDLLANPTQDQIVATGFLRNGMINEEGAIVFEQFRMEGLFDRMDCIGKAVLGLSIQCAQCHSHKFDPLAHDEYYGMFAFLNDTFEAQTPVYSPPQLEQVREITAKIAAIEDQIREAAPLWQQQLAAWESRQREAAPVWTIVDPTEAVWIGGLNHPAELPDHSIVVLGHPTASGEMYVAATPPLDQVTGLRLEALTYGDLAFGGPGRDARGRFAITECKVEVQTPGDESWQQIKVLQATADFSEPEQLLAGQDSVEIEKQKRVGPVAFVADDNQLTAWRADRGPGRRNTDSVAVLQFAEPISYPAAATLKVSLILKHSEPGAGAAQLGRLRLALTTTAEPKATPFDHAAALALRKAPAARSAREGAHLFAAWRKSRPELRESNEQIEKLQREFPEAETSVLSLAARQGMHRRETSLLDRGGWDKPLQRVLPGVPAILHPLPQQAGPPTRLDFARWLADSESPLTARVQVNRVWQSIFGEGLVATPEDFGTRAPPPEYLEILDTLAVQFVEEGWSTKQLVRMILSSDTYQQTSRVAPRLFEEDPNNRWLARGPRFRADAEVVRDLALSVAGLLNRDVGGPSVFPPVPQSVLDYNYTQPDYWLVPGGPERYRRAIYVFRKRSMPDPALTSFDAPNADAACARRDRSDTPLAGLVSLNEPIFVEAARGLALRILREGGTSDAERSEYGFRLCTGTRPSSAEQLELASLLGDCRRRLAEGWLSINEVATGDPGKRPQLPADVTPQDAAAWTIAARVLLNLDETLCKN